MPIAQSKKNNQQKTIWNIFLIFPENNVLQFMQTISFSLGDNLDEISNAVLSNYVFKVRTESGNG